MKKFLLILSAFVCTNLSVLADNSADTGTGTNTTNNSTTTTASATTGVWYLQSYINDANNPYWTRNSKKIQFTITPLDLLGTMTAFPSETYKGQSPVVLQSSRANIPYAVRVSVNNSTGTSTTAATKQDMVNIIDIISACKLSATNTDAKIGICYFDLSDITFDGDLGSFVLPSNINSNCLFYFKENTTISMTNAVVGETAQNIILDRNSAYPFCNTKPFTATNMTITEVPLSSKYVIFCFPFALGENKEITLSNSTDNTIEAETSTVSALLRPSSFTSFVNRENSSTLNFSIQTGIAANTPYMMNCKVADKTFNTISATNVEFSTTFGVTLDTQHEQSVANGWKMSGTYQAVTADLSQNTTSNGNLIENIAFYGMSNNTLAKASSTTTFKPFSGYMICGTATSQYNNGTTTETNNNGARISVGSQIEEDLTAIDDVESSTALEVTAQAGGVEVFAPEATQVKIYSITGAQKFNGKIHGTQSFDLNAGVYIINGKKYIVK